MIGATAVASSTLITPIIANVHIMFRRRSRVYNHESMTLGLGLGLGLRGRVYNHESMTLKVVIVLAIVLAVLTVLVVVPVVLRVQILAATDDGSFSPIKYRLLLSGCGL